MKIHLINFPMKYGCHVAGADTSFEPLKQSGWCQTHIDTVIHIPITPLNSPSVHIEDIIMQAAHEHHNTVNHVYQDHAFPLSFGGDHTCGLGGVSASLNTFNDDVTLLWIDAHADTHTPETSLSHNLHGMPLAILEGLCAPPLRMPGNSLRYDRLIYLGLSNCETAEVQHITHNAIAHLPLSIIQNTSSEYLFTWLRENIKTRYVYLSFDCDVLNPQAFFAVNVNAHHHYASQDGLSVHQVFDLFTFLCTQYLCVGCDVVEYNPTLDNELHDFNTMLQLLHHLVALIKANPYTQAR